MLIQQQSSTTTVLLSVCRLAISCIMFFSWFCIGHTSTKLLKTSRMARVRIATTAAAVYEYYAYVLQSIIALYNRRSAPDALPSPLDTDSDSPALHPPTLPSPLAISLLMASLLLRGNPLVAPAPVTLTPCPGIATPSLVAPLAPSLPLHPSLHRLNPLYFAVAKPRLPFLCLPCYRSRHLRVTSSSCCLVLPRLPCFCAHRPRASCCLPFC